MGVLRRAALLSAQQPGRRTSNARFAANQLGLRDRCGGTAIGKSNTQSGEIDSRVGRMPLNHGGILEVLAKDEVRFKKIFV